MINIEEYVFDLIARLKTEFKKRLIYVGLQGSFRRGEANENSDIDIMVTLDKLSPEDLELYRNVISAMPYTDRSCGFISGKAELKNWPRYEICQLLHETKDYYGELSSLVPEFTPEDIKNHIAISIGNLYHMLCHSKIHAAPAQLPDMLKGLYKAVFYVLQNSCYLQSGKWIMTQAELLNVLQGLDKNVLETAITLKSQQDCDYDQAYRQLFAWCHNYLSLPA